MGQVLHGCATTTHAVRTAIQRSKARAPPTCLHPCFPVRDNERAELSFLKTRKILLNIARAWRERVDEAEKKIKDTPSSVDGD